MNTKVGGCVIFYNPGPDALHNIATFGTHIDLLLIIDNSPIENPSLLTKIKAIQSKTIYTWMGGNKGIAAALNVACQMALQHNCEWLLTMDQDSRFKESGCLTLLESIEEVINIYNKAGIICPYHNIHDSFNPGVDKDFQKVRSTMTSGNLLNLPTHQVIGGFKEKLFIDYVDHEYCLRLRKSGFHIIQNNRVLLEHSLGNFELKKFLWKRFGISNHNPKRRYYITRNGLYTFGKYFFFDPTFCLKILRNLLYDLVRVLFFEKDKLVKSKAMTIGFWHWTINRFGTYDRV
jgi:rhamnosyltransferase